MTTEQINIIDNLPGWCSPEKRDWLCAQPRPINLIVEIGVFGGKSLLPMALTYPEAKVYGIDPWLAEASIEGMLNQESITYWQNEEMYSSVMTACKLGIAQLHINNIELIRDKSENVYTRFKPNSIDILSIDGCHSAVPAMRDAVNYLPLVKVGGIIACDDMHWTENSIYTVKPMVLWLLENGCEWIEEITGCAMLRKIK